VIPTTNISLKEALIDTDNFGVDNLAGAPLRDRKYPSGDVSLAGLGGTALGMNATHTGFNQYAQQTRSQCWSGTGNFSYGVRDFTASNTQPFMSLSRNTTGDAVLEARYQGQVPPGNYTLTGQVNRNFAANAGAPGAIWLFGASQGYMFSGSWGPTTIYDGADWASAWGDGYVNFQFTAGSSQRYLTLIVYHKVFGTIGGHQYTADINTTYYNSFSNLYVRSR
jgi:hypothetical protein